MSVTTHTHNTFCTYDHKQNNVQTPVWYRNITFLMHYVLQDWASYYSEHDKLPFPAFSASKVKFVLYRSLEACYFSIKEIIILQTLSPAILGTPNFQRHTTKMLLSRILESPKTQPYPPMCVGSNTSNFVLYLHRVEQFLLLLQDLTALRISGWAT